MNAVLAIFFFWLSQEMNICENDSVHLDSIIENSTLSVC